MSLPARLAVLALLTGAALAPAARGETASAPAPQAASRLDAALARGVLRVGTTGDYKPFTYSNPETGGVEGIDIDMAHALAKAMGVEVAFVKTSWPTLVADLLANKVDLAMGGDSVSLERQKTALYSLPYLTDGKAPIARCADKEKYRELAAIDRPEVRVITNPGGTNERFARERLGHAAIAVYPDNVTIFDQIAEGKADVMVTDASEILLQQKLHPGVLCAVHPETPFNTFEKAYLLPRDVILKAFVDQWLHQAMLTGDYQQIADKWLK